MEFPSWRGMENSRKFIKHYDINHSQLIEKLEWFHHLISLGRVLNQKSGERGHIDKLMD